MARHRLTDAQWELIADVFPEPAAAGRPSVDPRDMMDAILWRLRTGAPWRDLPEEFGPWNSVDNHLDPWNSNGTLHEMKRRLRRRIVDEEGIDAELGCIDGTVVRAARCAAGGAKKGSRGAGRSGGLSVDLWALREPRWSRRGRRECDRKESHNHDRAKCRPSSNPEASVQLRCAASPTYSELEPLRGSRYARRLWRKRPRRPTRRTFRPGPS
ncbi:MAG TPA: IS5 family transposase [Planctomycetes bacterium]|nr:IS5 family transposase [Planctomycetota bacterium]